jgi:hypothetical protein
MHGGRLAPPAGSPPLEGGGPGPRDAADACHPADRPATPLRACAVVRHRGRWPRNAHTIALRLPSSARSVTHTRSGQASTTVQAERHRPSMRNVAPAATQASYFSRYLRTEPPLSPVITNGSRRADSVASGDAACDQASELAALIDDDSRNNQLVHMNLPRSVVGLPGNLLDHAAMYSGPAKIHFTRTAPPPRSPLHRGGDPSLPAIG